MARPSKKQEAERKEAKRLTRQALRLERGYLLTPFHALADWAYIICETCGREQSDRRTCLNCGGEWARTHPLHDEFRAELERLRDDALAEAAGLV